MSSDLQQAREAAERLLDQIDGVHVGAEVQPGVVIATADVIQVCRALLFALTPTNP